MKKSGFLTRVISAVVLVIILLTVGIIGSYPLLIVTVFVSLVGLYELYKALGIYKDKKSLEGDSSVDKKNNGLEGDSSVDKGNNILMYSVAILSIVYFAVLAFIVNRCSLTGERVAIISMIAMLAYIVITLFVLMGIYVFTFPKFNVENIAFAFLGPVYVIVFMSCTYLTRCLDNGLYLFWLIFISSWICDTFAYLVGCTVGKHRLAPVLSPKKSIEGSIGGILGALLVAYVYGYFIEFKLLGGANNSASYMIICGIGSVISQIGDLAASAIKRNKEIKDYGTLIPGHGGILDRFDSVIFVAPAIYLLAAFLF